MADIDPQSFSAQRTQHWIGYFIALLVTARRHGADKDADALVQLIGETIKATYAPDNEADEARPGYDLPIAEHLEFARVRGSAAQRAFASGTVGEWMLPHRVVSEYLVVYGLADSVPFTVGLQDRMAADVLRDWGLDDFISGEYSFDDWAYLLGLMWSDAIDYNMEPLQPPSPRRPPLGPATVLAFPPSARRH